MADRTGLPWWGRLTGGWDSAGTSNPRPESSRNRSAAVGPVEGGAAGRLLNNSVLYPNGWFWIVSGQSMFQRKLLFLAK